MGKKDTKGTAKPAEASSKEKPAKGGKGGGKDTSGGSGYTKIKVRHILCEKQTKIMQAMAALGEGKAFPDVAKEFSEDKARSGGDLGWKLRGEMVGPFQDAAFALAKGGMTAEPIKTQFGYHIILVEDKA
jgi:peptidyl-prolyl cis-trans isomerase NIMA-interacting 4